MMIELDYFLDDTATPTTTKEAKHEVGQHVAAVNVFGIHQIQAVFEPWQHLSG